MTDSEKRILLNWQQCKIKYDLVASMQRSRDFTDAERVKVIGDYSGAVALLKIIRDEHIVVMVKEAYKEPPDPVESTRAHNRAWKKWRVRTTAAQDRLLTESFKYSATLEITDDAIR